MILIAAPVSLLVVGVVPAVGEKAWKNAQSPLILPSSSSEEIHDCEEKRLDCAFLGRYWFGFVLVAAAAVPVAVVLDGCSS